MKPHVCPLCEGAGTHAQHKDAAGKCAACHGERIVWGPKDTETIKYVPMPYPVYPARPTPIPYPPVWSTVTVGDPPGTDLRIGTVSIANDPNLSRVHSHSGCNLISGDISTSRGGAL